MATHRTCKIKTTYRHTTAVRAVCDSFEFFTEEIDEVMGKPWLKTAIISHVEKDTGLPKLFVFDAVNLIYTSNET